MTNGKNETALTIRAAPGQLRNKTANVTAIQRAEAGVSDYVPHLSPGQVKFMAYAARSTLRMKAKSISHLSSAASHNSCANV